MPSARATVPSCWARSSIDLLRYARERGASPVRLAARLPFDAAMLRHPDQRIPISRYYDVIEAVAEVLDDPLLGVSYIEQVQPADIDAVGFLAKASRTLGEALQRIIRHHRWITEGERFELDVAGEVASFSYTPWGPARPAHLHAATMYAADCMVLVPRVTGLPVQVLSFELMLAPLAPLQAYVQRLGATPRFHAAHNSWRLPASVLARAMPEADPGLVDFFSRYLDERRPPTPGADLREQVRQLVCEALPDGAPTLAQLAARLHTSERSLQRRLAEQGSSLAGLVDEVRRTRALAYLAMQLPATEVSLLLGYAEPAVFRRAFKRWTGQSTTAWRAAAAPA